jgi:formylglycine-generating enzyme required for sulfatase activity
VIDVSWNDAREYVAWLSSKTGEKYRLPSEAEWEYAARAGTTTERFWGNSHVEACRYANVYDESGKRAETRPWPSHECDDGYAWTAPVGSFQPNAFGLEDMLGNVWEWTEDCWNETYEGAPTDGGAWTRGDCGRHVVRGGSWRNDPIAVRSAFRGIEPPGAEPRHNFVGFRPAMTLPIP